VGLVQREIEAAGVSTVTLSSIPDLTSAVSVPRLVAIERPLGYLLGQPGDEEGQRAVLRSTLQAMVRMARPGSAAHLPYEWPEAARRLSARPAQAPPISRYLKRRPWLLPNLLSRNVPAGKEARTSSRPTNALHTAHVDL
jgi:D-proline reductase (dithiol) PrdB